MDMTACRAEANAVEEASWIEKVDALVRKTKECWVNANRDE